MELEALISLFTNNGIGIACLIYLMIVSSKTLSKITDCLTAIISSLSVIKNELNIEEDKKNG